MEKIFVFFHYHRHGHDVYLFRGKQEPSKEEVISAYDINLEDSEDEWLELDYSIPIDDIATYPDADQAEYAYPEQLSKWEEQDTRQALNAFNGPEPEDI